MIAGWVYLHLSGFLANSFLSPPTPKSGNCQPRSWRRLMPRRIAELKQMLRRMNVTMPTLRASLKKLRLCYSTRPSSSACQHVGQTRPARSPKRKSEIYELFHPSIAYTIGEDQRWPWAFRASQTAWLPVCWRWSTRFTVSTPMTGVFPAPFYKFGFHVDSGYQRDGVNCGQRAADPVDQPQQFLFALAIPTGVLMLMGRFSQSSAHWCALFPTRNDRIRQCGSRPDRARPVG